VDKRNNRWRYLLQKQVCEVEKICFVYCWTDSTPNFFLFTVSYLGQEIEFCSVTYAKTFVDFVGPHLYFNRIFFYWYLQAHKQIMKVLYNSRNQSVNIDADTSMTVAALKDQLQDTTGINPMFQEVQINLLHRNIEIHIHSASWVHKCYIHHIYLYPLCSSNAIIQILCEGRKLRNVHTLGHYKLNNESTIEVHVHMNGGCSESCGCCGCSEGCSCTIL
jgi:hypothetical protein